MKRNPIIHWLLAMLTLGQYSFVWAYLMARDVNQAHGYEAIELRKSKNRFLIQYSIHIIGFLGMSGAFLITEYRPSDLLFFALFINAVTLMIFFIKKLTDIAKATREILKTESPSSLGIVVLSLIYMLSLPRLQSSVNKIEHIKSSLTTPGAAAPSA